MNKSNSQNDKSKDGILKNHKKIGKRFIPPLKAQFPIKETRWVDYLMPEVVWLGLLHYKYGLKDGVSLSVKLAQTACECLQDEKKRLFANISAYQLLNDHEKTSVINKLTGTQELILLKQGLVWLIAFYPKCPLSFLFDDDPPSHSCYIDQLSTFKDFLSTQFNRREISAMFTQATAVYIGMVTGVLHVRKQDGLAHLQAIIDYPMTEESRQVAASVRACITGILGNIIVTQPTTWATYFWNQGLQLEHCDINSIWRRYEQSE